jgi:hypothetical protein
MIINLLSNPRNISTALMYSFAQRPDTKVVDEPFYAYYLHLSPVPHPGREEVLATMPREKTDVLADIYQKAQTYPVVFLKNMAHHLIQTDFEFMRPFTNLFLIRNPKQLIASFAQVYENPTMSDIGLAQQMDIFKFLSADNQSLPLVLDSGELLKNPPKVMAELCERLNIPFTAKMLNWSAGAIPEDGIWAKYWYANVHQSTGFDKQDTSERPLPSHCQSLYEEAKPHYDFLYQYSIKA